MPRGDFFIALLRPCERSLLIPAVRREPCEVPDYSFGEILVGMALLTFRLCLAIWMAFFLIKMRLNAVQLSGGGVV